METTREATERNSSGTTKPAEQAGVTGALPSRTAVVGGALALILAVVLSTKSGVGVAIGMAIVPAALAVAMWPDRTGRRWAIAIAALSPWLIVRDNTWLSISIVSTTLLVSGLVVIASATQQRVEDMSLGALVRLPARPRGFRTPVDRRSLPVSLLRGAFVAAPVVAVFWTLLASADDVFADIANPSVLPIERAGLFAVLLPVCALGIRITNSGRTAGEPKQRNPFGVTESSVVLGAVSVLFFVFISLRLGTIGRSLSEEAWRTEVRSGFFQLLWVAALTVMLVLAIRQVSTGRSLSGRLRTLAFLTITLAAIIDVLAMVKIAEYVARSFLSPLRFWSFSFGLWLLVVLALTAVRLTGFRQNCQWFTGRWSPVGSCLSLCLVRSIPINGLHNTTLIIPRQVRRSGLRCNR